jgi:hypothetical protein
VRLYEAAFTEEPRLAEDGMNGHRSDAARAAALVAAGQGKDQPPPDDKTRLRWRKQALTWLRADVTYWAEQLEGDMPPLRGRAVQTLRSWQWSVDLAAFRDAAALAKLPEDEREAWRKLWADAAALLAPKK